MGKAMVYLWGIASLYYSKGWGKGLTILAEICTVLALLFVGVTFYFANTVPKKINGSYSRYAVGNLVSYSGEIINSDELNAEKLAFKGKFQSRINRLDVDAPDIIEMQDFDNKSGVAQFTLARLSSGNHCKFDIIVDSKNDKNEDVQISWEGGKSKIELREADKNLERGIELSEKVRGLDVSHDARRRWVESNTKIIGAPK